jgi:hypothetical protein
MDRDRVAAYGRLEGEFRQERAAALGRIGRTLERLIARLHHLRDEYRDAPPARQTALEEEYARTHRQAVTYRWYLEVQREAVGLRRHDRLDESYRVPSPGIAAHGGTGVASPAASGSTRAGTPAAHDV